MRLAARASWDSTTRTRCRRWGDERTRRRRPITGTERRMMWADRTSLLTLRRGEASVLIGTQVEDRAGSLCTDKNQCFALDFALHTRRAYKNDIKEFMTFTGIRSP